jgi:hypothetical protein
MGTGWREHTRRLLVCSRRARASWTWSTASGRCRAPSSSRRSSTTYASDRFALLQLPARLPRTVPHSASADEVFALVPQVLTVEEPQTTWTTQTRTEWTTEIEHVPRTVYETGEDKIVVTTTRNGSFEHEEVLVRFLSFRQQLLAHGWASLSGHVSCAGSTCRHWSRGRNANRSGTRCRTPYTVRTPRSGSAQPASCLHQPADTL